MLLGFLWVVGGLVLVAVAAVATVLINSAVVANASLEEQAERLAELRQRVDSLEGGAVAGWVESPVDDRVDWNRVQSVATHNSYAVAPNGIQSAVLWLVEPGELSALQYSHPPLWDQLDLGVRSFELDVRVHSDGALRTTHVPLLVNGSNAPDFALALEEVALWSTSHPGHLPVTVLVEFKSDYRFLDPTLADWSPESLTLVDEAVAAALGERLLRPAELEAKTAGEKWPRVGELRDRVMVIMHPGGVVDAYSSVPAAVRTMFVGASGGEVQDAAAAGVFVVHNDPDPAVVSAFVDSGAVVRTRADADLVLDPALRDRALASGAQLVSTDFPGPLPDAASGYAVAFEGGALSRIDPARMPTAEELRRVDALIWVEAASVRDLAGSVVMATIPGTDAARLRRLMSEASLGGFILMGGNVPGSPAALAELTAALTLDEALPPLIAIDEEGGYVRRLPWDSFPGANTLRFGSASSVQAAFEGRARLLRETGVNVNFGIVADVTADRHSFIYGRSLGDSGRAAAPRVAAAVEGERGAVSSTLKHFPGHGAAPGDSHFAIPRTGVSLERWRDRDAVPFQAGVDAGAELLMFGHLAYTSVSSRPASVEPEWYRIAREELGFTGVTVTDDLAMLRASGVPAYRDVGDTAVAALVAGADVALVVAGMDFASVVALVDRVEAAAVSGELPLERLTEASLRVTELRLLTAERAAAS